MSKVNYEKAYKLGKKEYQQRISHGEKPTLMVLDDILPPKGSYSEVYLGMQQIPVEQIVGTKTNGRSNAFASNFMPILEKNTEFAGKWISLSESHEEEGIREPVKAYEYMNQFYVEEGNKRVSVMKYFDALYIPGTVTRLVPQRTDKLENKIYYEFLDFYEKTQINYLHFSKEGSYEKLQELIGKDPEKVWTEEERQDFSSIYYRFRKEFKCKSEKLSITTGDAFLVFIELHGYKKVCNMYTEELRKTIANTWEEFNLLDEEDDIELKLDPTEKKPLLSKINPFNKPKLKIAFLYEKTPDSSDWTYGHELGRIYLEQVFPDEVETIHFENVTQDNVEFFIGEAISEECNVIITTTPSFTQASVKAAIDNPKIRFLNCSVNTSHRYIRTYYVRMHEVKFLMGAIAGAMADNDKITYIADYPIYGTIANINAFALGAKMVNPRAKVYLDWRCKKNNDTMENIKKLQPSCVSARDMLMPNEETRYFGIYYMDGEKLRNLAMPLLHWGKFYEQLVRAIIDGSWEYDDDTLIKAINYWWGMSAGVIDVVCSRNLPIGTERLIELLKTTIMNGEFNPFTGVLYSQDGVVQPDEGKSLSPEEIVNMDWLAENVIGEIPSMDELLESAIPVVMQQGIEKK